MNVRKVVAIVVFSLISMAPIAQASDWSATLVTGVLSRYLTKPGFIVHNKPIATSSLTLSYGEMYGGIWGSGGIFDGKVGEDYGDEVDGYVGFHHKFFDAVVFDTDIQYFMITDIGKTNNDLWIFDARLDWIVAPIVQPYFAVRHFGPVGKNSPVGGWIMWPGFQRQQPLNFIHLLGSGQLVLNFDFKLAIASGNPFHGGDGLTYGQVGISTVLPITERLSFIPSVLLHIPNRGISQFGAASVTKPQFVYGLMLQYNF